MATVSYRLEDLKKAIVGIGYVGENDHMHVLIDCKEVFDEYPDAVPTMAIVPPVGESYPKVVNRNGDVVEWLVKNSDVAAEGDGEFQITFTEGEVIKKSVNGRFRVIRSISGSGNAPSGYEDWETDANEKLAAVEEATQKAEDAANHQPYIGIDGYWYTWNGEEFVKNVKAQGNKGDPGDPGSPGDPTQLIDDTAGEGQTGKTWSADKLDETTSQLLNHIQGKQDAPSTEGTSGQVLSLDSNLHPVWVSPSTASIEDGSVTKQKLSSDVVAELNTVEEASGHYEKRLLDYDGTIVPPKYKAGLIRYVNNGTEASGSNNKRMSFASGQYLSLKKGDTVNRDNTWILEFGGGYYTDNMTVLHAIEGTTLKYTCPADGEYFFWTTKKAEAVFTPEDEANAYNALIFNREPNTVKTVSDMKNNVDGMVSIPITLSDGYYSDVGTVQSPSTSKEKYTQKYNVVSGMTFKVVLQFIESAHASWVAACEWLNDGTFYRRTLTSATAMLLNLTYTPGSNVKQVAFTFRGFDDYELTITTRNIAFLATVSGNVVVYDPVTYDFDSHRVKGINHRGFYTAPENTIPAYQKSVEEGFKFVETDVRFTSDGVPVLLHDESINRTARNSDGTEISGTVNIASITYAQALEYDFGIAVSSTYAGTKIPTFEQFIVFCRNKGLFPYIEISGGSFTSAQVLSLVEIVKKYNMQRAVTWISFYHNNLMKVVAYDPCARVGRLPSGDSITAEITKATELRTGRNEVFINLSSSGIDSTRLNLCVTLGLPLETWTINAEADMLALDDYISGVTSDQLNFEKVLYDN